MKSYVFESVGPPPWCVLQPDEWREHWREVIARDESAQGCLGLGWVEQTTWGHLRWEALSYYEALALAEGASGWARVLRVVVDDPTPSLPPGPRTRMHWWRWSRQSRTLHPNNRVRSCAGTEDVLEGLVARVHELTAYLAALGNTEVTKETAALAHRLLWDGVGLADQACAVPEARDGLLRIHGQLYQLSLAAWEARELLVAQQGRDSLREVLSEAADLQQPIDAVVGKLKVIHTPTMLGPHSEHGSSDGTDGNTASATSHGSTDSTGDGTGPISGTHVFDQVNAVGQPCVGADSFYGPPRSSNEENR